MSKERGRLPPYVSYVTWGRMLEGFEKYLPDVVDSSYYSGLAFSGTSARKLRSALRFLGLTNEASVPTEKLKRLVRVLRGEGKDSAQESFAEILRDAYPSMFEGDFSLKRADAGQLLERFESMGASGDLKRQCASFFLHLAADAGFELSPHLAGRSKIGVGRKSVVLKSKEKFRQDRFAGTSITAKNSEDVSLEVSKLHPAIIGLLRELPVLGQSWQADSKEKFKKAFEAVLDLVYPNDTKR